MNDAGNMKPILKDVYSTSKKFEFKKLKSFLKKHSNNTNLKKLPIKDKKKG